ncbi:pathogenicity island protein [Mammaliicoccus sp. I-M35]|uniref:pathogenicity island protein n=1 Tax=Mammaliicoccus sp. I-M35 TaxID=2898694 RepID=UPI001EFA3890|nr:pathogenicity island protein [Mammaliicoccus sp. I-M35]
MNIKQREELSNVVRDMDKVINQSEDLRISYNIITANGITETHVIERAIEVFRIKLFNIQCEFSFNSEEHQIISGVIEMFEAVSQEKQDIYFYSVLDQNGETRHATDRKGHLIGILEWALDQIAGNIDVGVI